MAAFFILNKEQPNRNPKPIPQFIPVIEAINCGELQFSKLFFQQLLNLLSDCWSNNKLINFVCIQF